MNNKVTVLIPTFNRAKVLKRAIASVLRQSYSEIIIIVSDNASTDETESVVRELISTDNRIEYFKHKFNVGALENLRYVFSLVQTPYFCFLSDDDLLAIDCILDSVKVLNQHANIDFVIQNSLWINTAGELISTGNYAVNGELKKFCNYDRFDVFHNSEVPFIWTGMLFRGELSKLYTLKSMNNDIGHDIRYLFRVVSRHNFAYLSKVGAFFTSHFDSMSSARPYFDMIEHVKECERYIEILEDESVDSLIKERVANYFLELVNSHPYKKSLKEALRHLVKNCCNSPELPTHSIFEFANNFRQNGFPKTADLFSTIFKFKSIRFFVKLIYGKFNSYRFNRHRNAMKLLQNTIYKSYFEDIKKLH